MEIAGDLALQTKIKWPLREDDLAHLLHSLREVEMAWKQISLSYI